MLSVGSLFSGIGGFELGLERTGGFKTVWQCEKDEFCLKVLAKHWPDVKRFTDIKEMKEDIPYVDVICGGFPCQPVSCAGKRKGAQDERWLWPEFYRVVCEVRPGWVIIENVPGLLSADSGRLFAGILRDLSSSGYDAEWNIVSAAFVGAPHLRKRVFVVAHSNKFDGHNGGPGTSEVCRKREQATIISGSEDDVAHTASQQDNTQYIESRGLGEQFRGTLADRREAIRPEDRQASHNVLGGCSQDVAHAQLSERWPEGSRRCRMAWPDDRLQRREEGASGAELCGQDVAHSQQPTDRREDFCSKIGGKVAERPASGLGRSSDGRGTEDVAHPISLGRNGRSGMLGQGRRGELEDGGEEAADTESERLEGGLASRHNEQTGRMRFLSAGCGEQNGRNERPAFSRLGIFTHGLSEGLADAWRPGWEDGTPRLATGQKDRVNRLKALGNAIVPQCSEYVGRCLLASISEEPVI